MFNAAKRPARIVALLALAALSTGLIAGITPTYCLALSHQRPGSPELAGASSRAG